MSRLEGGRGTVWVRVRGCFIPARPGRGSRAWCGGEDTGGWRERGRQRVRRKHASRKFSIIVPLPPSLSDECTVLVSLESLITSSKHYFVKPAKSEVVDPELVIGVSTGRNHMESEPVFGYREESMKRWFLRTEILTKSLAEKICSSLIPKCFTSYQKF